MHSAKKCRAKIFLKSIEKSLLRSPDSDWRPKESGVLYMWNTVGPNKVGLSRTRLRPCSKIVLAPWQSVNKNSQANNGALSRSLLKCRSEFAIDNHRCSTSYSFA